MKAIGILISPTGEEFYDAYGSMTKDRDKATEFVSHEIAAEAARSRFGRTGMAFWESERQAERNIKKKYAEWTFRTEDAT
jgi:hypothetical protein